MKHRDAYTLKGGNTMQQTILGRLVRCLMAVFVVVSSLALLACPGDDDEEFRNVDATFPASSSTVQAVQGQDLPFTTGQVFGAPGALNVRFVSGTQAVIGRPGGPPAPTATSTVTYASCNFMVTATSFPAGQGPQVGQTISFPTCNFRVIATNLEVGGDEIVGTIVLILVGPSGSATSTPISVEVRIDGDGNLIVNDVNTNVDTDVTGTTGTTGG